jgi:hypothetical protein
VHVHKIRRTNAQALVISGIINATPQHMTQAIPQLKTGDVIQLIHPIGGVAAGTRGIIVGQFTFDLLYDVRFDGYVMPRLVYKRDVAPVPPKAVTA